MLRKLFKYEMRSTGILYIIFDIVVLAVSLIAGFTMRSMVNQTVYNVYQASKAVNAATLLFILFVFIYIIMVAALCVITLVMIIQRFWKNMLGAEGYLMHTLPVPVWKQVMAKTLSAFVWQLIMMAVGIVSLLMIGVIGCGGIGSLLQSIGYENFSLVSSMPETILSIICAITSIIYGTLMLYAAMALGAGFNKHKVLLSFLIYIGFVIVLKVISVFAVSGDVYMGLTESLIFGGGNYNYVTSYLIPAIIRNIVFAVAFFFITSAALKRRLNLE